MAEIYTEQYKESLFYVWVETGDRTFGKSLLDRIPTNENGSKPNLISIKKWAEEGGWEERADALDAQASLRLDELVIDKRVKMYERLAEIGTFEAEEGFKYLKEHGIKKEETALRAISDGANLMKEVVGVADMVRKIGEMTPEQLDRELQKLLGVKKDDEFIQGEVTEENNPDV